MPALRQEDCSRIINIFLKFTPIKAAYTEVFTAFSMVRRLGIFWLIGSVALFGSSCSRQSYRVQTDREVYSLLKQGTCDPRWTLNDYRITPKKESRMFDPFHPDREPMPADDPAAHRRLPPHSGNGGKNGWTPHTENPRWRQFLPVNEKGEVPLDKDKAVDLALLHSPEYQSALEGLYLAAMKVSQERYRYEVQFFGGGSLFYTANGRLRGNDTLASDANLEARRLLATGGEFVAGLANSITWSLSGKHDWGAESILNISLVQPLLRGAGRKIVLENLTQTERDFLAAVRQMVFFQQGFYTKTVTGAGQQAAPAGASGGTGSGSAGFYGLLAEQIRIQNQRQNVISLEENLDRFIEMFEANQVSDVYQVEETRQNLLVSQSGLLKQINLYHQNTESYVRSLGLPPDLKVNIDDPLLEQFRLISPSLTALQEEVAGLLAAVRKKDQPLPPDFRNVLETIIRQTKAEIAVLDKDLETLRQKTPERIAGLNALKLLLDERIQHGERIEPDIYDTKIFEKRIADLRNKDIPKNLSRIQAAFTLLELIVQQNEILLRKMIRERSFSKDVLEAASVLKLALKPDAEAEPADKNPLPVPADSAGSSRERTQKIIAELRQKDAYRDWIRRVLSLFQYELASLSLLQTRARLDALTLVPVTLTPEHAFASASEHRLDWMNRKAQLADSWRQIEIAADKLRSGLDLTLQGELGTIDRSGVKFDGSDGQLRAGLTWDSPLTRHNEMLDYRRRQIEFQNARRNYYVYVDGVQAELRNILRNVQMSQIDFEINRNAVLVDTVRVDVMQLRMEQPPQRGGRIDPNTATQLINALNGLMNSQNNFLNTWITYQTQRMLLDLNMGTMTLDASGRWIDSGTTVSGAADTHGNKMILAPPVPRLNRKYVD